MVYKILTVYGHKGTKKMVCLCTTYTLFVFFNNSVSDYFFQKRAVISSKSPVSVRR